jgi:hypothetical protein
MQSHFLAVEIASMTLADWPLVEIPMATSPPRA